MRSVKKILATALAVAMVTSVSVPVMAAEVPVAEEQTVVVTDESVDKGLVGHLSRQYLASLAPAVVIFRF